MSPPVKNVDYKVGDKVKVCSKEQGFVGSYYEATIVSCLKNGKHVVRYKNLLEDDNSEPLKETIFPKELRRLTPCVQNPTEFKVNQLVDDVFDSDGWWLGKIISEKIISQKRYYYMVYFFATHEVIYYPCNRIRVHHEWFHMESGSWKLNSYHYHHHH